MDVKVGDVSVKLRVSPLLATLLMQFRDRDKLSAADLATRVGVPTRMPGGAGVI